MQCKGILYKKRKEYLNKYPTILYKEFKKKANNLYFTNKFNFEINTNTFKIFIIIEKIIPW